jgi:hypothetical protein
LRKYLTSAGLKAAIPAVQSASAKASANQGKQGRSLLDRHVGHAAKFRRLYG